MKNLKSFLPALMRTQYYNAMMDSIEEVIDDFKKAHIDGIRNIYSISDGDLDVLLEIASSVYSLDRFQMSKMYEFLVELETSMGSDDPEGNALARFRQEIQKLPYELKERGTIDQYAYLLDFCDFNYPGIITLTKTSFAERVGAVVPSFSLKGCSTPMSGIMTPVLEEYEITGEDTETIRESLDYYEITSEGASGEVTIKVPTLDSLQDGKVRTLDKIAVAEVTLYRRTVYFGLLLSAQSLVYYSNYTIYQVGTGGYEGGPTFPEELGKYYKSFINLNRRGTDVLIFGPLLSLNLGLFNATPEHPGIGTSTNFGRDNRIAYGYSFGTLTDSEENPAISALTIKYSEDRFESYYDNEGNITAYEMRRPQDWKFFYENRLNPANSYVNDFENGNLTLFSLCKGERNRHYYDVVREGTITEGKYYIDIPEEEWTSDITVVLRNTTNGEFAENEYQCSILRQNSYGDLEQSYSSRDTSSENANDITVNEVEDYTDEDGNKFKRVHIESIYSFSGNPLTEAIVSSQRLHSKVQSIAIYKNDEEEPWVWIWLKGNTAIGLTKGIDMGLYLCIHYNVDTSTIETISAEAGETEDVTGNV